MYMYLNGVQQKLHNLFLGLSIIFCQIKFVYTDVTSCNSVYEVESGNWLWPILMGI